jgi:hypothetical protein
VHSRRAVPIHRSAIAFAHGARTGVLMTRTPSEVNTSSKALVYLELADYQLAVIGFWGVVVAG